MTENTQALLAFIIEYKASNDGNSPSFSECAKALDVSVGSIQDYVKTLQKEGKVTMEKYKPRSIKVIK